VLFVTGQHESESRSATHRKVRTTEGAPPPIRLRYVVERQAGDASAAAAAAACRGCVLWVLGAAAASSTTPCWCPEVRDAQWVAPLTVTVLSKHANLAATLWQNL